MIKILFFFLIIVIVLLGYFFYLSYITYNLNEISILKKSLNFHGDGLFATEDLKKGIILLNKSNEGNIDDFVFSASCSGQMNDADFVYPKSFSYDDLYDSFYNYENIKNTKNNVEHTDEKYTTVIKNIYEGTEITKTYGMTKWFGFIYLDIVGENPLTSFDNHFILTEDEKIKATLNLVKVAEDLGYTLTIDRKKK